MRFPTCARQAGLSLVELMVGMLVGLIGIIIISHLYITNEQYKRSTTGSGAAQVNGAIALYTIERDLRMAGYGINHTNALGCTCIPTPPIPCSPVQYYYDGAYSSPPDPPANPPKLRTLQIAPVVIVKDPNLPAYPNVPASITLLYGGDKERSVPTSLSQPMAAITNYDYISDTTAGGTAGFETNDLIVVTGGATGDTCALAKITVDNSVPNVPNLPLKHPLGPAPSYNPDQNGSLPVFSRGAMVFNLGITPVWRTFSIVNNKLVATEVLPPLLGAGGQALVDDIVDLQALYGMDDGVNNGTVTSASYVADDRNVDGYSPATPTNATGWQRVLAVRIAVLARSQNYEQPDAAGVCRATTAANQPMWSRTAAVPAGTVFPTLQAAGALPSCYKYRVFETIVPLRNMIWR